MILSSIHSLANSNPDGIALRFENEAFSYRALVREIDRVAGVLASQGVVSSTPVGVYCENNSVTMLLYYAVSKIGGTFVPMNSVLTASEAAYIIDHAGIHHLFVDDKLADAAIEAVGERDCKIINVKQIQGTSAVAPFEAAQFPKDDFLIVYTSGSTGVPKAVRYTQSSEVGGNESLIELWNITPADKVLVALPLGFLYGLSTAASMALQGGAEVILLRKFRPSDVLDAVLEHRVTVFQGVPTMFSMMLEYAEQNDLTYDLSFVRLFISAGAPLSQELRDRFQRRFNKQIEDYYALTEVRPVFGRYAAREVTIPCGSIGQAAPGVEVKFVGADGQLVSPGSVGEVWVKAPATTSGYFKAPELTDAAFESGFFKTGDLGYCDADGFYYLTGRIKDIIIKGGANIAPAEVEEAICAHPAVQLASVIGIPDPKFGELPLAFFVTAAGRSVSVEELTAHCRARLAEFKVPVEFIQLSEMPLGSTAKIDKKALVKLWEGTVHA
ncbi:class I adenylate-forming enzyme family protein [Pseudomonas taiwanensis]|uniref:class I adenylate-forming enzyme family protein n=1 Tax=Pseudomonas taiwanensis TaxID=470150 RepID=UPI001647AE85|nr:class I adenylate-forming enzyme family protein [Pseudomonas taiwanensis]MBC3492446.1 acyl--CoA ligase [Pseudomonas taiwanensis]